MIARGLAAAASALVAAANALAAAALPKSGGTMTGKITSTLADGTAPLDVTSTTVCPNLNAYRLEGNAANAFAAANHNLVDTTKHPMTGLTTGHVLQATAATTYGFAAAPAHAPASHNLVDATGHAVTGLTTGHGLHATGATTYGFSTCPTAGIADAAVTYAKIQNVSATARVLGRKTAAAGVVEELAAADLATLLGTTLHADLRATMASATLVTGDAGGAPAASGTTQAHSMYRMGSVDSNTILDFGYGGSGAFWLQCGSKAALGTNYALALNPNGGNVGIGTVTPGSDTAWSSPCLDISGGRGTLCLRTTSASGNATLRMTGPGAASVDEWHINCVAGASSRLDIGAYAGGTPVLSLSNAGMVTVKVNIETHDGGVHTIASDGSLKNRHSDFTHGLKEILAIVPYHYTFKASNKLGLDPAQVTLGVNAEDVALVIPEAVMRKPEGHLGMDNSPIFWAMLNAIKELAAQNADLVVQVKDLSKRVEELEKGAATPKAPK